MKYDIVFTKLSVVKPAQKILKMQGIVYKQIESNTLRVTSKSEEDDMFLIWMYLNLPIKDGTVVKGGKK